MELIGWNLSRAILSMVHVRPSDDRLRGQAVWNIRSHSPVSMFWSQSVSIVIELFALQVWRVRIGILS
jgi:hypothetical protein